MDFFTAVSVLAASAATIGLGAALLCLLGFRGLPKSLLLGVSYGAGVVIAAKLLHLASCLGLALSTASWVTVAMGLIAGVWAWRGPMVQRASTEHGGASTRVLEYSWFRDPVIIGLLSLLAIHISITLFNNLTRPIFPWDAFTTWMYRAKAWTLQNAITAMSYTPDWIAAGGTSDYAIYANDYPSALSIYAAFVAALTGGWNEAAASLPWSFALIAACGVSHGSIIAAGLSQRLATLSAYFLGSLPVVNIHASLAGYADLWMLLLSGSGLALLLFWRCRGEKKFMLLAAILLLAGTQIKTEGWLWLGLGVAFVAIESLADRFGCAKLLVATGAGISLIWLLDITTLSLGPLGSWGVSQNGIQIGVLGSYAVRPYNPLGDYFRITFSQANFLVLGTLYLFSTMALVIYKAERAVAFWFMGGLIAVSQGVIFGLSAYSQYAEIGTAITRILLHFAPVAILTCVMGWSAIQRSMATPAPEKSTSIKTPGARLIQIYGLTLTLVLAALVSPALLILDSETEHNKLSFDRKQFEPVAGRVTNSAEGLRFTDSPISVGVLKAPIKKAGEVLPNYLKTDVSFRHPGDISFYWIPDGSAEVQSVPLAVSGYGMTNLGEIQRWLNQPIREIGFLVQEGAFDSTSIKGLQLKGQIERSDTPGLLNHWSAKEPLGHRLINTTQGHIDTPLTLISWASISLVTLLLAVLLFAVSPRTSRLIPAASGAAMAIWVTADIASLSTSAATPLLSKSSPDRPPLSLELAQQTIDRIREATNTEKAKDTRILVVGTDQTSKLIAERLPFDLLPHRGVFGAIPKSRPQTAETFTHVILVGNDSARLATLAEKAQLANSSLEVSQHAGFAVLSAGAR